MSPQEKKKSLAWIRWILFSETLILLFALAAPGFQNTNQKPNNQAVLARFFFEEPSYLQAVAVNFVAFHLFVGGLYLPPGSPHGSEDEARGCNQGLHSYCGRENMVID